MLQQSDIDRNPIRKQYFIVLPQLRNSTRPDSYAERLHAQKQPYFSLFQKQVIAFCFVAVCFFLLAFEVGLIEPIYKFLIQG